MDTRSLELGDPAPDPDLGALIRRDQLGAMRDSLRIAIPVNGLLGPASLLVAIQGGNGRAGAVWFSVSLGANLLRMGLCRAPCPGLALGPEMRPEAAAAASRSIDRHLRLGTLAGLSSGLVWAGLPLLCAGYTSAQATFYLVIRCGITAGAVRHGTAFARIPLAFITPPLLTVAGSLAWAGGFDSGCLAAAVPLYAAALARASFQSEAAFREASRLKYEAKALAQARADAHAGATALAEEMRRRATHDDLTGLLNRAGFSQEAERRLGTGAPCLLVLDLDGFKSVNDSYGHKAGDRVLVEVARRLRAGLPADGLAARLGGDEFAILYDPAATGRAGADLARALIARVGRPFESFDAGRLGASVGIHAGPAQSLTQLLSCADAALYAAKASGRNGVRVFDAILRDRLEMRRDTERDLPRALIDGQVVVWFQPIYARDGRRLAGLEALVRWRHPDHGWIPPGDLIAAAAAAGLSESLLQAILEQVCGMMEAVRALGLGAVRVAMNVSPREMAQAPVDKILIERLRALGLPPAMLEIEITEETALDIGAVQGKLAARARARAGIRVALDDFGTGYSSLSSLRQLRADRIKIDRSLVTGLGDCPDRTGMVQAVLGLGASLGLEVVAEGIETEADLATLQALGCPFLQGYHLGRPMPRGAVDELLRTAVAAAA